MRLINDDLPIVWVIWISLGHISPPGSVIKCHPEMICCFYHQIAVWVAVDSQDTAAGIVAGGCRSMTPSNGSHLQRFQLGYLATAVLGVVGEPKQGCGFVRQQNILFCMVLQSDCTVQGVG